MCSLPRLLPLPLLRAGMEKSAAPLGWTNMMRQTNMTRHWWTNMMRHCCVELTRHCCLEGRAGREKSAGPLGWTNMMRQTNMTRHCCLLIHCLVDHLLLK